ncbi:hypothetical protein [Streptomyces sp. NPDC056132]|uniref:hypothetical protein n=1 Tax=Streptomyces sp. NPDC056132 TaxID=3345722 RepID=UPI0035E04A8D
MTWNQAAERAGQIAAADVPPALRSADHWDWVAIRGVLAVVLQALAVQTAPGDVPLRDVLEVLERGPAHVRRIVEPVARAATESAAADTWRWLTRTWPRPSAGPHDLRAQYGGMSRGIGAGHTGAAVDTVTPWAARAVERAMEQGL